jgi:uncharacterized protein YycO
MNIIAALKLSSVASLIVFLTVACGGKLTQENFDKVTNGMPVSEVKSLLGEPSKVDTASVPLLGTITTFTYETEKGKAAVILKEDKVQSKVGSISK